ncbi:MAG: hypothetical protein KDH20_16950 [Rhodocyclaceae bacterium]|nr:hypothetical protein [Rhodocyclaceae bacterium]
MRTILFLLLLMLVVFMARRALTRIGSNRPEARPDPPGGAERMLACSQCGLHIPESEAIRAGGDAFCCPEHQRQHTGRGS